MTKLLAIAMLLMCSCSLFGEPEKPETPRRADVVTRVIQLKNADPRLVRNMLADTGARISFDRALRLVVISGTPADVQSLEETIRKIDAQSTQSSHPNVELTVFVLAATVSQEGPVVSLPALDSVIHQLQNVFPYKAYKLIETVQTRSRVGNGAETRGVMQPLFETKGTHWGVPTYSLRYDLTGISNQGGVPAVQLDNFQFVAHLPSRTTSSEGNATQFQTYDAVVNTTFDVKAGQKIVVGKAGVSGDDALFVVVEAKVVD